MWLGAWSIHNLWLWLHGFTDCLRETGLIMPQELGFSKDFYRFVASEYLAGPSSKSWATLIQEQCDTHCLNSYEEFYRLLDKYKSEVAQGKATSR